MRGVVALAVGVGMLAACSGGDETSGETDPTTPPAVTQTAVTTGPGSAEPSTTQSLTTVPDTTTSSTAEATTTSTVPPPAEHRIGVRIGENGGEFYDRTTGETWVPRGFNHWQWDLHRGYLMDRTFRAGDNGLEQAKVDLAEMASYGYDAVRIWVTACFEEAPGCMVDESGEVRPEYIANVAEYLEAAKANDIVVMFTVDDIIGPGRYDLGTAPLCCDEWGGFNLLDLTAGGIADQQRFWTDLIEGLMAVGAPMDAIWAYELRNEQFFEEQQPPLSTGGVVTAANGSTYDLDDPVQRTQMLDEGLVHWARTLSDTIHDLDPTALVTVGYFPSGQGPEAVGYDQRLVDPGPLAEAGVVDFIDYRTYPGLDSGGWDWMWTNSFLADHVDDTAILLGETGAFHSAYDTIDEAITAYTDFIADACRTGLDGWLGWVWDNQNTYTETWSAVDEGYAIAEALSSAQFPDPCEPPPPATGNLAYNRPATASLFEDTEEFSAPPRSAVDGSEATWWTAPDSGPQWIEIDLERVSSVERIVMITELGADTPMTVDVELLGDDGAVLATHRFETSEAAPRLDLEHRFDPPVPDVRRVRATTYRDAWIIWHEIEVYGAFAE